jgi:hypothetical protein
MSDFVNLKINPAQFFEGTHRGRVCVYVFIGVGDRMCMSIYVYTVFLKKNCPYIDLLGLGLGLGLGPVHSPSISSHLVSHGSVKLKGILFSEN